MADEKVVKEVTTEVAEAAAPAVEEVVVDNTPHDEFDWDAGKRQVNIYSEADHEKFLKEYESTLSEISEFKVVSGTVKAIHGGDVVLDLNFKSDGLVSLSEFRDTPDLGVGDSVDVYVEQQEDARGQLVLSRRKAKLINAWENIKDSYENGTVLKGVIISKTKGGLIVDLQGLETFLPGSQIDIKPIIDYDSYVGKMMEFKVVKINEVIKNAVVSHKALIESDLAEQRDQILAGLEKGQVLEGVVKNITDFGAFVDLEGMDGLLHITDMSWGRVPWQVLDETIAEGSTVKGKIVNIEDYGAFLEITPGVEGLIHVSEISWGSQPINSREYFSINQMLDAKVVTIDREDRKMSLSIKQMSKDPWSEIGEKFPIDSSHKGKVKNLTQYGVFVELEDGIGGMVHISDLSWTKRYSHAKEFTSVGQEIDVVILEIDSDNRKLSLGHKQLEENPWQTFEKVFPAGSYHEATVIKRDDRGAILQLPYGLEAYAPSKHVKKEDNTYAELDEVLTVKVIEFNRDDKRIIVSHARYVEDIQREARGEEIKEQQKERNEVRSAVKKTQSNVERSTLGDIGALAALQAQFTEAKAEEALADKPKEEKKEEPKAEAKAEEKVAITKGKSEEEE